MRKLGPGSRVIIKGSSRVGILLSSYQTHDHLGRFVDGGGVVEWEDDRTRCVVYNLRTLMAAPPKRERTESDEVGTAPAQQK